jgi:alpha-N-arabinofuranosidase
VVDYRDVDSSSCRWDELKAFGSIGLEQTYDYTDMLGFCGWLHALVRKHKDLGMACLAQTVNVVGSDCV